MALVQSNACDPFDRLFQREILARILSSEQSEDVDHDSMDWSSDSEHEYEEQDTGRVFGLRSMVVFLPQSRRLSLDEKGSKVQQRYSCENLRFGWLSNMSSLRAVGSDECQWKWDTNLFPSTSLRHEGREVLFHPDYSCGTAAAKGEEPLEKDAEHYWEVKMTSAVYGTDMMIGVGTKDADLAQYRSSFCSILGRDSESWGLSYFGTFHHDGKSREYTTKFDQGTTIGVHLDTWSGKLAFLKDGKCLGMAADGLRGKDLYPVVSSTAARTKMRLMRSTSVGFSLQYLCCAQIGKVLSDPSDIKSLPIPPGVKHFLMRELDWIFKVHTKPRQDSANDAKRKRRC